MKSKQIMSMILAISMIFSCLVGVTSAEEIIEFALQDVKVTANEGEDLIVRVPFVTNIDFNILTIQALFSTESQYVALTGFEHDSQITITATDEEYIDTDGVGHVTWIEPTYSGLALEAGSTIWTAVFTVSKDAPHNVGLPVKLEMTAMANADGSKMVSQETYTSTITITEPEVEKTGYEVYYELDKVDGDSDKYNEYGVNDTVTVHLWMNNYEGTDSKLQAYDIYLKHSDALVYSAVGTNLKAQTVAAEDGFAITHIQYYGNTAKEMGVDSIDLGTVSFTIDSDKAVYGQGMDITIVPAVDSNADGEKAVTNIAIGATAGDKKSYYPTVSGDVLGVEVDTTYDVIFNANGGEFAADAVTTQTKQHGVDLILAGPVPTRDGYSFEGWNTVDVPTTDIPGTVYANGDAYTANEGTTLYAQWKEATADYTVKHFQQSLTGGYVEVEADRQTLSGTTGELTAATANDYTGFTAQTITQQTIVADGSTVVSIYYDRNTYTITFFPNYDGATSGPHTQTFTYGETVTLSENPFDAPTGFVFNGWNTDKDGNGTPYTAGNSYTLEDNLTLYAQWNENAHEITLKLEPATGGSATISHNSAKEGDLVTVTVTTNPGYNTGVVTVVDANGGNVDVTNNQFTMPNANVTVTVTFEAIPYDVTVEENIEGGSVTTDATDNKATVGQVITLTATPAPGYKLDKFTVVTEDGAPVTVSDNGAFTMPAADVTVSASFILDDLKITVDNDNIENGTVTAPESAQVGENVTLTATPDEGYEVTGYTVTYYENGEKVEKPVKPGETFEMPAYEVTITATFDLKELTVTVNNDAEKGTVTFEANAEKIVMDTEITLSATANAGYSLTGYTVTYEKDGKTESVDVSGNKFTMPGYDVTVTPIWSMSAVIVAEQYAYITNDYFLLRVTDDLAPGMEYQFNSQRMYWTDDSNYQENGAAVFYYLISADYVTNGTLNEAGKALLKPVAITPDEEGETERATINYNGDINGDGVVNIADANVVYQMIQQGAGYYSMDADNGLTIEQRLMADMSKAGGDHRGSIDDVHAIVTEINSQPTT